MDLVSPCGQSLDSRCCLPQQPQASHSWVSPQGRQRHLDTDHSSSYDSPQKNTRAVIVLPIHLVTCLRSACFVKLGLCRATASLSSKRLPCDSLRCPNSALTIWSSPVPTLGYRRSAGPHLETVPQGAVSSCVATMWPHTFWPLIAPLGGGGGGGHVTCPLQAHLQQEANRTAAIALETCYRRLKACHPPKEDTREACQGHARKSSNLHTGIQDDKITSTLSEANGLVFSVDRCPSNLRCCLCCEDSAFDHASCFPACRARSCIVSLGHVSVHSMQSGNCVFGDCCRHCPLSRCCVMADIALHCSRSLPSRLLVGNLWQL